MTPRILWHGVPLAESTERDLDAFYADVAHVLRVFGGATALDDFDHCMRSGCREYRFQGHFGFGGKYRTETNRIDYYPEDRTPNLDALAAGINAELVAVAAKYNWEF